MSTQQRTAPLHIAFVWNMHQPYYQDMGSGEYLLPWVRMHGIKDYYMMVHILRQFPEIHQTFNLVPSLLKQIKDYTDRGLKNIKETSLQLFLKPAAELTRNDKVYLLYNFFMANWEHLVYPHPRYAQLLRKRGQAIKFEELDRIQEYFSTQDFLDLQIWFNLSWIDPFFKTDPRIASLLQKGEKFQEEDKLILLTVQEDILKLIIPEHAALAKSGQIELITSPMYHPILPLLCDSRNAHAAMPGVKLPHPIFSHPEDAAAQLAKGVALFKEITGITPNGMWPSEGSVCEEIIPLIARQGIKWIATDEQILAKSLDTLLDRDGNNIPHAPELLYQPYWIEKGGQRLNMIFRDHLLSDLIGFNYSRMDSKDAASDMVARLLAINKKLPKEGSYLVTILLDGENAWEYYVNNGVEFLIYLYEELRREPMLKIVTVSEYLKENPARKQLKNLFSGSWIDHNFRIWIGHEEDNSGWEQINLTRQALVEYQAEHPNADPQLIASAWEEIYIAEGSDWFWWYGEEHNSANDEMFDNLFRQQLINVYNMLGLEVPKRLYVSNIIETRHCTPQSEPKGFLHPVIDGMITNYFEWLAAGNFDVTKNCSSMHQAMHQSTKVFSGLYFGFNPENLFLRLDFAQPWQTDVPDWCFKIFVLKPSEWRLDLYPPQNGADLRTTLYKRRDANGWEKVSASCQAALGKILEIKIPLADLKVKSGDVLHLSVTIEKNNLEVEHWPGRGYMIITVPGADFEALIWQA
ncbi:MAG: glycoside hydrolase [Candidatus Schekmanbacteria bacterium]|nr:glycoside hydrolase [Candidatus Schekmanbacteria bacterium]